MHARIPAGTKRLRYRRNKVTSFSIGADFHFVLALKPLENYPSNELEVQTDSVR
jgi:hypothetical protein